MISYIYDSIPAERKLFTSNPKLDKKYARYVRICNLSYIITYDYRYFDVYNKHPVDGLIVSLGAIEPSMSDGSTDKLIDNLINDIGNKVLVAEINEKDTYSKHLFENHGFKLDRVSEDTLYYVHDSEEII